MFQIETHRNIRRMFSYLHLVGVWYSHEKEAVGFRILKLFYTTQVCLYSISVLTSVFTSDTQDDSIFLAEISTVQLVLQAKFLYMIWRKTEILELFNRRICCYSLSDRETFVKITEKLENFMKFITIMIVTFIGGVAFATLSSVKEKTLFIPTAFPLDWRNDEFAFWMAFSFFVIEDIITSVSVIFTVIIWYLMATCSWRFDVLGNQLRKIGEPTTTCLSVDNSIVERNSLYQKQLVDVITSYNCLNE